LERKKCSQIARYFVKVESEADLDKDWPSNLYNRVPPKRKEYYGNLGSERTHLSNRYVMEFIQKGRDTQVTKHYKPY
jgi:hypothetical protein